MSLHTGMSIASRYRLERELGRGAMGVVWSATHLLTGDEMALKFVTLVPTSDTTARRRFVAEARATLAILHPSVIRVHDVFELDTSTWVMAMEQLTGATLRSVLDRDGALPLPVCAAIMKHVTEGLRAAHAHGCVHRDLKPANIFLVSGGAVLAKVLDFGVAKHVDGPGASITASGALIGTPLYMAPEQASRAKGVDHRADVWSLGVVLYECLAGFRPIDAQGIGAYLRRLATSAITPLAEMCPELPDDVTGLVSRMLQRDPSERPTLDEASVVLAAHADIAQAEQALASLQRP